MGLPGPELFLDDHRGVYIPRDFAECVARDFVTGVTDEQYAVLADPESDLYWDVWSEVTDSAMVTTTQGVRYRLYQDGALWLLPEGMEVDDNGRFCWSVGTEFHTTCDSQSLGIARGTLCTVAWSDAERMDLTVPSIDTTIAGVNVAHPDLELASSGQG